MAEHTNPRTPPTRNEPAVPRGETPGPATDRRPAVTFEGSLGFVVEESDPLAARTFCDAVTRAVPPGVGVEFLVLDDHTNPERRELVREVDASGDSARLVPRPSKRSAELDAVSLSACSEFIVLASSCGAPWEAISRALEALWADGSDVVVVGDVGDELRHPGDDSQAHHELARYLGFSGVSTTDRVAPDSPRPPSGSTTVDPQWFVVLRRWVARWLFSEPVSAPDVQHEIAARAGLLGLQMLVLDSSGLPFRAT